MQCGAKTRSGKTCQNTPVKGRNRCRMHGGNQPRANESPNFKHGLYSKYAGQSLKKVIEELDQVSSDELINPDNEIKLMEALIITSKQLQGNIQDIHTLDTISKIIERLIHSKQRSQAIQIEQQRLIPARDIEKFLDYVEELLTRNMEEQKANELIDQFKNFRIHEN